MRSNELRIGNIIGDTLLNTVVVTIDVLKTIDDHTSPIGEDGVYKPMPLTEEWLLKFGFEQPYDDVPTIFTKDIKESPFEEGFRIEERDEVGCYMIDDYYIKIKYVHQLQNLYFALTGNELEIKES